MELTKELLAKAKEAQTADELLALAKENGIELTQEQSEEYFAKLHQTGELADEELDNVSGGSCNESGGAWTTCPHCGYNGGGFDSCYIDGNGWRLLCPRCQIYFWKDR